MHQRKMRRLTRHGKTARLHSQLFDVIDAAEHAKRIGREFTQHHHHCRFVQVFVATGADADADRTDPVRHVSVTAQKIENIGQAIGKQIGDVQKPQIGRFWYRLQLAHAVLRGFAPLPDGALGKVEWQTHARLPGQFASSTLRMRAAACGLMPATCARSSTLAANTVLALPKWSSSARASGSLMPGKPSTR